MEFSLWNVFFCLHQEGVGRSVLDGAAPMLATLFLAPGLTNVEMWPTRVVGRGGVSYSVLQYSFMVVWHRLLLWGTVWMWDFAWKNWLEHEHEQAYDYDNREQVCFRLYCLWVGLSCLAVFLVATLWRSAHRLCPWQWCRCCWSRDGEDKKPTWCSERPKQLVLYRRSTHMVNPTINKFPGSSV